MPDLAQTICSCGDTTIFAVHPGTEAVKLGAPDLFTPDPLVAAPRADIAWCRACWDRRFGAAK